MNSLQKNIYVIHSACVFFLKEKENKQFFFLSRILRRCKLSRISDFCVYVICITVFFFIYGVHGSLLG